MFIHIFNIIKSFWRYLGKKQHKLIRILHIAIASFVLLQIIDSNFIKITDTSLNIGIWVHIITGLMTALLFSIFLISVLRIRGIQYFYPYFFKNFTQIKRDIAVISRFKLPEAEPYGLAAVIQGVGLLALLLVVTSGVFWFIARENLWFFAHSIRQLHKNLTTLIEIYIIAHGAMGIVHFLCEQYYPQIIYKKKQ